MSRRSITESERSAVGPADSASPIVTGSGSWLQRRLRAGILFYQRAREGQPSPCRFFPSCSSYALEAVEVHGPWRGGWLTVRRLLRCRPLGPSGFDPVPEKSCSDHISGPAMSGPAMSGPAVSGPADRGGNAAAASTTSSLTQCASLTAQKGGRHV